MAWTTPKTFTAGSVLTAAEMNTHVRDNLNETCPATATAAGDLVYADAANSMGSRLAIGSAGSLLVSTGSGLAWRTVTSSQVNNASFTFTNVSQYYDLDAVTGGTAGTACNVTLTTGTQVIVLWRARMSNSSAGAFSFCSYRISGATTQAASDGLSMFYESSSADDAIAMGTNNYQTLTAGSNTFELQARVTAGTCTMQYTEITVISL